MNLARSILAAPLGVLLLGACAAPATGLGTSPTSAAPPAITSPIAASSSVSPWGAQDGMPAVARTIACGPKPHGADAGLARYLADSHRYDHTPYPGPPTTPPTPPPPAPSPPPVPGQFEWSDLTLVPPPSATKPAACVDVALTALQTMPAGVGSAQPAKVWLAILSAPTPASINADGSFSPYFTDVLAWVFYFDDLPPMCPAGGPVGSLPTQGIQCDPASLGPSSAILSVDATTAEPLTNVYSGGPMLTP
jgi:hypothetical protein